MRDRRVRVDGGICFFSCGYCSVTVGDTICLIVIRIPINAELIAR
jgi:hypothetical protein